MSSDIIAQIPKMNDIRKNLKDGVDSNPILKYIVGTVDVDGELRKLSGSNPIKAHQNSHHGLPVWFTNISDDNIEKLKSIVGSAF